MKIKIKSYDDFLELSQNKGWLKYGSEATFEHIEETICYSYDGNEFDMPSFEASNVSSEIIEINEECIIQGTSFGIIHEDNIYPGGLAHSSVWLQGNFDIGSTFCEYTPNRTIKIDGEYNILGIMCHWGHFFVDALDRVLKYKALNRIDENFIISDSNHFNLTPRLDSNNLPHQITSLLQCMDIKFSTNQLLSLSKKIDYKFDKLTTVNLTSRKPAISKENFIYLQKLFSRPNDDLNLSLVFIGRKDILKRFIVNQEEVVNAICKMKGVVIFPEENNLLETMDILSRSNKIILPIGSAKFNLIFCNPGARVICIVPDGYSKTDSSVIGMVRHICHCLNLKLAFYECRAIKKGNKFLNHDLVIDSSDLSRIESIFEEMLWLA